MLRIPMPVFMSITITIIGLVFGAMWNPGYTSFNLKAISISCMLGGFSLWLWILQRTLEGQSICAYEGRPYPIGKKISNKEIAEWFYRTLIDDVRERNSMFRWFWSYVGVFLVILAMINLETSNFVTNFLYIGSVAIYTFMGVGVPRHFMVGH